MRRRKKKQEEKMRKLRRKLKDKSYQTRMKLTLARVFQ